MTFPTSLADNLNYANVGLYRDSKGAIEWVLSWFSITDGQYSLGTPDDPFLYHAGDQYAQNFNDPGSWKVRYTSATPEGRWVSLSILPLVFFGLWRRRSCSRRM